jgi:hypothetical protein
VGEGQLNPTSFRNTRNLNSVLALLPDVALGAIAPLSSDNARSAAQKLLSGDTGFLTIREHFVSIAYAELQTLTALTGENHPSGVIWAGL